MVIQDRMIVPARCRRAALGLALGAAALAGCQDLDVANPVDPDRDRTVGQPAALEALVSSTFATWWPWVHDDSPVWAMSTMADEFSAAFFDFGILIASSEPRVAYNNSQLYDAASVNQDPWYGLYSTLSNANDALRAMDAGVEIGAGGEGTPRARAFAKFMQGLSHGYLALYFDQAYVVGESIAADTLTAIGQIGIELEPSPYQVVMDTALAELAAAVAIADSNEFDLPGDSWLYQEMDNAELARLAHSYRARLMAQVARTREERDAVDWQAVLNEIDAGITSDFAPVAIPGVFVDDFKRVAARSTATFPGNFARVDYMLVGPADSTNGFLTWLAKPPATRTVFQLVTADRRIHPAGQPAGEGKYFGYSTANRFAASRGTYHQSRYYFHRFGRADSWQTGPQAELLRTEMDLLKAEALVRLGRAGEAVPLVNATRVANGELPPVTVEGPPDAPGCVPRQTSGACGSLWDALRYEKRVEGAAVHPPGAFLDARGWQTLPVGTPVHLPVPGRELATLQKPLYTFGGEGGDGSAPPPEPERCPVALPRCP